MLGNCGGSVISALVDALDGSQELGVDRFDRGPIDGLNSSLHLALVYFLEDVEARVRDFCACCAFSVGLRA